MEEYPLVSIVVPVYNREDDIERCISSLMALKYPSYEIVVVDNSSTDKTQNILSRFPIKMIVEKKRGAYIARNTGIEVVQGEIVAFTDSDCVVEKDWLSKLVQHFKQPEVGGVGGSLVPYSPQTLVEEFLSAGELTIFKAPQTVCLQRDMKRFPPVALGSANISYRKKILDELGGFDESLTEFGGDYELCWRVQGRGYKVIYDPEAVVNHRLRRTIPGLIKQFYSLGKGLPLLFKKQRSHCAYFIIKTYIFPKWEFSCRLPFRVLATVDFINVFILGLILVFLHPVFLYFAGLILFGVVWGSWRKAKSLVKKSGSIKWFILYPFFHIIQNYACMAGRVTGGIKHRVISF